VLCGFKVLVVFLILCSVWGVFWVVFMDVGGFGVIFLFVIFWFYFCVIFCLVLGRSCVFLIE